jgi:hypothetical protein
VTPALSPPRCVLWSMTIAVVTLAALVGCSSAPPTAPSGSGSTAPAEASAPSMAPVTSLPATPATPASPPATTAAPSQPASTAPAPTPHARSDWPFVRSWCPDASGTPLLLVALGTSETAGQGLGSGELYSPGLAYPGRYAEILCAELGRPVELHSYFPSQSYNEFATVDWWHERLTGDTTLRGDLAKAGVVVIWPLSVHDAVQPLHFRTCGSAWPDPMKPCVEEIAARIGPGMDADFAEIRSLVPKEATVLAADAYLPPALVNAWTSKPFWPELRPLMDPKSVVPALAKKHGFTFVDTELAFNSPDSSAMPEDGLFQSDGLHPTEAGALKVAELFAQVDRIGD